MTKHQRRLLPHFKQNLLNFEIEKLQKPHKQKDLKEMLDQSLSRTIAKSKSSKLNRRILQNIDFTKESSHVHNESSSNESQNNYSNDEEKHQRKIPMPIAKLGTI